jgi:putative ABC transport system permease protein
MLKNYFKVAIRSFFNHRQYTIINLLGLSLGVSLCILIMLFVRSEFSYDKFHSKSDRLYRAWMAEKTEGGDNRVFTITCLPLGPALRENVPDIEYSCRVYAFSSIAKIHGIGFDEPAHMVDTDFFKMFDFKLVQGDVRNPWPSANSVIISETMAKKLFGEKDVIGRNIDLQLGDSSKLFTISGLVRDDHPESSIKLDILIPFSNDHFFFNERLRTSAWSNISVETYVLARQGSERKTIDRKIGEMISSLLGDSYAKGAYKISLQPMASIHLDTSLPKGIEPLGNPKFSYIVGSIGIVVLLIACINFIILSIGYSSSRSLEVGVRKVLGAERRQLFFQFWAESFLLTLTSVAMGFALALLLSGTFGNLIDKKFSWQFDFWFWLIFFSGIVLMGFFTGIYPALIMSNFNPITVLKAKLKIKSAGIFQRILIAGQFSVSIIMLICTWIIGLQLDYIKSKNLGYAKENTVIVYTGLQLDEGMNLGQLYSDALAKLPEVKSASVDLYNFDKVPWMDIGFTDRNSVNKTFQFNAVDTKFVGTMGMKLVAGRNFFSNMDSNVIVNEAFVKEYGMVDPVGKEMPGPFNRTIIGVVKDFNVESLHTPIKPLVLATSFAVVSQKAETMLVYQAMKPRIAVRLMPGDLHSEIDKLKEAWESVVPARDFNCRFLDEAVNTQYKQDSQTGLIVKTASVLSILICLMGLIGMVTLTLAGLRKEIAIRKILGASVGGIIGLIGRNFIKIVILAALISYPLAWLGVNNWLANFSYRIDIPWWVFGLSTLIVLVIVFSTIGIQAFRTAVSSPVKSIKTE